MWKNLDLLLTRKKHEEKEKVTIVSGSRSIRKSNNSNDKSQIVENNTTAI